MKKKWTLMITIYIMNGSFLIYMYMIKLKRIYLVRYCESKLMKAMPATVEKI